MNEWLGIIVSMSVAGSVVLLLSFLITHITKGALTAKWSYWSRKLSLFFFLVPLFMIPELFSIVGNTNYDIHIGSQSIENQNTLSLSFTQLLFVVWIVGVIVTSVWAFYSYQRFKRKMKTTCFLVSEESEIQQLLNQNLAHMNLSKDINIVYSRCSMSPVLIGILKPTIMLPMYRIPSKELDMIIKHELTHFKKKDLWTKGVLLIATILHWYNPLVYLLRKEIDVWSELSCDEDVVMEMSHTERKHYGETILNMIERANQQSKSYFLGAFFSTEQMNLKRRLIKMLKVKKMSKSIKVLSSVALLTLGGIGLFGSVLTKENTPHVSVDEDNRVATYDSKDQKAEEAEGGYHELNSVKMSDESKFPKEEWKKILEQIEKGEVILEDE